MTTYYNIIYYLSYRLDAYHRSSTIIITRNRILTIITFINTSYYIE